MGDFVIFSVLVQSLVDFVRERFPKIDGMLVNAAAVLLGCAAALVIPEARVAADLFGMGLNPITNIGASGVMIALGSKFLAKAFTMMSTYRVEKPEVDT